MAESSFLMQDTLTHLASNEKKWKKENHSRNRDIFKSESQSAELSSDHGTLLLKQSMTGTAQAWTEKNKPTETEPLMQIGIFLVPFVE